MKKILLILLFVSLLIAKNCPDEFNPNKFEESPQFLIDLIDDNFIKVKLFSSQKEYQKLNFTHKDKLLDGYLIKPKSFKKYRDYIYPQIDGLWSYHIDKNRRVDMVNISQIESKRVETFNLSDMINSDFEGLWNSWDGNGYEHFLLPKFTKLKYNNIYFTLKVTFWGVMGDAAKVNSSVINYELINFTKEVGNYIKCKDNL